MSNIVGLGWLNTNATRNYPLSQEASTDPLGDSGWKLPDDLIVDMRLSVPYSPSIKPFNFYLKAVSAYTHGVVIEIGYYNPGISTTEKATVAISEAIVASTHTNPQSYELKGVSTNVAYDFSNVTGVVTIGNLDSIIASPPGRIEYDYNAYLESTVISLNTVGVSSVRAGKTLATAEAAVTGHVVFRPRTNFGIAALTDQNTFVFSALNGIGLQSDCTCEGEIELGPCITSINNVGPDSQGNIDLVEGTCISIQTEESVSAIKISETCSEPCCGCDQLTIIVSDLRDLQAGFERLDSYITALGGAVESIRSSAFGSVIASNACNPCADP
jgi:hypothetical protein